MIYYGRVPGETSKGEGKQEREGEVKQVCEFRQSPSPSLTPWGALSINDTLGFVPRKALKLSFLRPVQSTVSHWESPMEVVNFRRFWRSATADPGPPAALGQPFEESCRLLEVKEHRSWGKGTWKQ